MGPYCVFDNIQPRTKVNFIAMHCRHRLELMRQIYNSDVSPCSLSPSPPPERQGEEELQTCIPACNQARLSLSQLLPARLINTRMLVLVLPSWFQPLYAFGCRQPPQGLMLIALRACHRQTKGFQLSSWVKVMVGLGIMMMIE